MKRLRRRYGRSSAPAKDDTVARYTAIGAGVGTVVGAIAGEGLGAVPGAALGGLIGEGIGAVVKAVRS